MFKKNCCDGIYNSFDVHFTSLYDNKCAHCIDSKYCGLSIQKPDVTKITQSIIYNCEGYDDVLFLGGEPCLFLQELLDCIRIIKRHTSLKCYVTTSVPKTCYDRFDLFVQLLKEVDGINLSVQHYKESIADEIRKTKSYFDRQKFYANLPFKNKIRINLNIVKPYLYKKEDILACLKHYDDMGFPEIKLSEIQHGKEYFGHAEDLAAQQMGYDSDEDYWADQEFDYELEQKAQAMEEIFQEQINKIDGNNKDNCGIDS